ncbi:TPM domain-containing protein [Microbacterium invictum]|uniref:TPM domain-containing protein n=1 Tax=Microbacterium invictum TaxID=515415 RepID=A0ABZ0V723_9MICO|nr:TPM domain-containing protein [Microbacterium invictum]WQB69402.1 TPM domain-containing protein [Microbacterium invictum]
MRARWAAALTAALTMILVGVGPAASATDPVELGAGYVVDESDVLDQAQESAVQDRLAELYDQTGIDLYTVFVSEFTNPADSQQWADEVARLNGLGVDQYVLAVATDGREYYISADSAGPVSADELTAIEGEIRPFLRDGDWVGAVSTTVDGFESATTAGAGAGWIFVLVVVAIGAIVVIWLVVRRRRSRGSGASGATGPPVAAQVPLADLERQASSALVDTDDAVRTSEQELGFARAQFGDDATVDFVAALESAKAQLAEAFTLKQRLDDEIADTDADRREWNERILQLCQAANAELDEKAADFDALRELERTAPDALARVRAERETAITRLRDTEERMTQLRTTYRDTALSAVADNVDQARQRLGFAEQQLTEAQTALDAGDGGEAAVGIRAAEEAVDQAQTLENAVEKQAADLSDAEAAASALIAELERETAASGALPDPDGQVAAAVAATRQVTQLARDEVAATPRDPLATLQRLQAADQQLDALVAGIRDAQAEQQRLTEGLARTLAAARARVAAAEDYIMTRRGAVGANARTRLAEAGAAAVRAEQLQTSDPRAALAEAQRAQALADEALASAQRDVGAFDRGGYNSDGMFGGGPGGGGGSDILGAILGGIVVNSLRSGGGSSRRSGGSASFGSRRSGGGGFRTGSFGGGGTRGRRGGGRF